MLSAVKIPNHWGFLSQPEGVSRQTSPKEEQGKNQSPVKEQARRNHVTDNNNNAQRPTGLARGA